MTVASQGCRLVPYSRRHPENTILYRVVQQHLETQLAPAQEDDWDGGYSVPAPIEREFRQYLECGIPAYGFARARCGECGHDFLVARLLLWGMAIAGFPSFGGHFIRLWGGARFEEAVLVLRILAVCTAAAQNPAIVFLYSLNKHCWYAAVTLAEAAVNVALSMMLVFKYGSVGVALGTMIPMLLVKIVVMPLYVSCIAGLSVAAYARPLLPSLGIAAALQVAVYSCGIVTGRTPAIVSLLLQGLITGELYVAAGYFLVLRLYGLLVGVRKTRALADMQNGLSLQKYG